MLTYSHEVEEMMKNFYETLSEKDKRRYAAIEALKLGHGGQKYICEVLCCDPGTVQRGTEELKNGSEVPKERIRKTGGGGKKIIDKIEDIDEVFLEIRDPMIPPGVQWMKPSNGRTWGRETYQRHFVREDIRFLNTSSNNC